MYQNYIFDLYGTLVDIWTDEHMTSLWKHMAAFYSLKGAPYSAKELSTLYWEMDRSERIKMAKKRNLDPSFVEISLDKVYASLYRRKGVKPNKQLVQDTMVMFRMLSTKRIKLFPGVKELLLRLKADGKGVYLLSNAQTGFTKPEMVMLGIYDLFDGILYSSDELVMKPNPEFFQILFDRYGLSKENSVMIGNDARADMMGAANFGIAGMYVRTDNSWRPEVLPNGCYEIANIEEVYP